MSVSQVAPQPKKQRPPPKPVAVASIERVTPGVLRIAFVGAGLDAFAQARPGAHMKLFFTAGEWPPAGIENPPRPPSRTYTPRRYDAAASRLEVEFVMHGAGLASDWAAQAKVGDPMLISASPGGGYQAPEGISHLVIIADDSALPAAGMVIESLPSGVGVTAICEVENAAEERPLSPRVNCAPRWLHRETGNARPGSLLETAVAGMATLPADAHVWVACEAAAMRHIRDNLAARFNLPRARLHTRGYWKFGDQNYPDHDYGED